MRYECYTAGTNDFLVTVDAETPLLATIKAGDICNMHPETIIATPQEPRVPNGFVDNDPDGMS